MILHQIFLSSANILILLMIQVGSSFTNNRNRSGVLQCFSVHRRLYGRILVHVQWTGTVAPAGRVMCENHMTVAWLNRQLICSESVVVRTLVERQREYIVEYIITAVLLEYCFTVWSIEPVSNTLLHDLNVEIGTTTESRVYRTLSWWRERCVWWHVEFVGDTLNPLVTREIRLVTTRGVRLVTRGDRDLVPARPSTRWTWVDSRFVRESLYVYRVACCRGRRPTFLKDTLLRRICYHYSFSFVISLVILIFNVSCSNFRCLFSLKFVP